MDEKKKHGPHGPGCSCDPKDPTASAAKLLDEWTERWGQAGVTREMAQALFSAMLLGIEIGDAKKNDLAAHSKLSSLMIADSLIAQETLTRAGVESTKASLMELMGPQRIKSDKSPRQVFERIVRERDAAQAELKAMRESVATIERMARDEMRELQTEHAQAIAALEAERRGAERGS